MSPSRRRKPFRCYRAGGHGHTVTLRQETSKSLIQVRWWDPTRRGGQGNWVRESLGHRDWKAAQRYADDKALERKWKTVDRAAVLEKPTLAGIFALYLKHETPEKSGRVQQDDRRRVEMFERYLGPDTDITSISPELWRDFRDDRTSGRIDARGQTLSERQEEWRREKVRAEKSGEAFTRQAPVEKHVRPRVVRADLAWLRTVARWAVGWSVRVPGSARPRPLLASNPFEGKSYPLPADKNPRQPVITHDMHLALLAAAGEVWDRLPALLRIADGTGRRLSSMLALWPHNRVKTKTQEAPFGGIRWPADADKMGKEWFAPISADVVAALDELDRLAGDRIGPYFESKRRAGTPVSRDFARKRLLECYAAAELQKPEGTAWHAYRRKFVTERYHLSDSMVAQLAGMSEQTVRIYRQNHPAGLYEALTSPRRLLEVHG